MAVTACQIAAYASDAAAILGGLGTAAETLFGTTAAAKIPAVITFLGLVGHVLSGYCPGAGGPSPSPPVPLAALGAHP